jgi:CHAD domain-containing protein
VNLGRTSREQSGTFTPTSKAVYPPATFLLHAVHLVPAHLSAQHVAAALAGAGYEAGALRRTERTLLDTFDGRLHAAGLRLEVNSDGGALRLTVTDGGPAPASVTVDRLPKTAGDLPAGPLRARLTGVLEPRALLPLVTVSSGYLRAVRRDAGGKVVVGVDIHDGITRAPGVPLSVPWSATVVAYEGYAKAAAQAARLLASLGVTDQRDPLALAAEEAGVDLRGFQDSPTVTLDPGEPAHEGYRRVLANLAATIEANRQGTIDDVDSEFLHDLRIAVRRSRSVLSHAKGVLPAAGRERFGEEFRWLGATTSPLRDADVYLIEWPGYVAPLDAESAGALTPLLDHIRARREAERAMLVEALGSDRYRALMTAWSGWLAAADDPPAKGRRRLGTVVASRIVDAQDRLLARGRSIGPTTAAEELHELRKDAKRLRYLLECFGGLLPAARRKPFVQRLKALQDNLGEHQDTEIHTAQLKAMSQELQGGAGVTTATLLAMGRLTEIFEQRRQQARAEFAGRFAAYDTKPTARALRTLLDSAGGR